MAERGALEQAAIEAAQAYAAANGLSGRAATGLVLVGMAIMAGCAPETARAMRKTYVDELPDTDAPMARWSSRLDEAQRVDGADQWRRRVGFES